MLAVVLEGGGARGAYQAGVISTLMKFGYRFNAVTGTSIGALNGVMLAQDTFDKSLELWQNMEFSKLFDFASDYAVKIDEGCYDIETIRYFFIQLKRAIANKGLDTSKIRNLIRSYVDEDKLRSSGIEFGLMTVSLTEMKPYSLYLEDIPYGQVADYVMASANFPGFSRLKIGDKTFLDGGLYDNLPINMLVDKGYTDILAIETMSNMRKRKLKHTEGVQVVYIRPSEKPGRMLAFNPDPVGRALKIGYYDALRYYKGYAGELYYLSIDRESPFGYGLLDMETEVYRDIAAVLGNKEDSDRRQTAKYIIGAINRKSKRSYRTLDAALLHAIEQAANLLGVERLKVYNFTEFMRLVAGADEGVKSYVKDKTYLNIFDHIFKGVQINEIQKKAKGGR